MAESPTVMPDLVENSRDYWRNQCSALLKDISLLQADNSRLRAEREKIRFEAVENAARLAFDYCEQHWEFNEANKLAALIRTLLSQVSP